MKLGYIFIFFVLVSVIGLKIYLKLKLESIDGLGGTVTRCNEKEKIIKIQ